MVSTCGRSVSGPKIAGMTHPPIHNTDLTQMVPKEIDSAVKTSAMATIRRLAWYIRPDISSLESVLDMVKVLMECHRKILAAITSGLVGSHHRLWRVDSTGRPRSHTDAYDAGRPCRGNECVCRRRAVEWFCLRNTAVLSDCQRYSNTVVYFDNAGGPAN